MVNLIVPLSICLTWFFSYKLIFKKKKVVIYSSLHLKTDHIEIIQIFKKWGYISWTPPGLKYKVQSLNLWPQSESKQ